MLVVSALMDMVSSLNKIDHHCAYTNNCIAKRNHRSFLFFIIFSSLFFILEISVFVIRMVQNPDFIGMTLGGVVSFICFISCCCTSVMSCLQCYLITIGATTNELIRKKWDDGNPFNLGCFKNCEEFCCGSVGPNIFELKSMSNTV